MRLPSVVRMIEIGQLGFFLGILHLLLLQLPLHLYMLGRSPVRTVPNRERHALTLAFEPRLLKKMLGAVAADSAVPVLSGFIDQSPDRVLRDFIDQASIAVIGDSPAVATDQNKPVSNLRLEALM